MEIFPGSRGMVLDSQVKHPDSAKTPSRLFSKRSWLDARFEDQSLESTSAVVEAASMTNPPDRTHLNFAEEARKAFMFLIDLGFSEIESLPTLVRYRRDGVEVDVYHGRQSYEIGAGITAFGIRYSMGPIIRHSDLDAGKRYRNYAATTPEGVTAGLKGLSILMKRYGALALDGDLKFFSALESERKSWSEIYALDVLADQLRPQADEAFRQRDYAKAFELYSRIRERLNLTEIKKLSVAEERCKD